MENSKMDEFVNTVSERSDICEVVSRYVPLTLRGGKFWACCPFHEEKTPSFSVSPDKGLFYCFGCKTGGNVFKFISLMEHVTYWEAVKIQAERLGIEIPSRKKNSEEIKIENEKDALLKITSLTRDFYHDCLIKSKNGEQGRKYLATRGITENVIEEFKIGFAPDSWDVLTKKITAQGYSEKQLVSAGLAVEKKNGGGVYDRLRGRVIIPISDAFGKVVAFGGRILVDDKNQPKYLNTPETEIFSKGKLLFGFDKSRRKIGSENTAIVVEGYMDAISLYSAGIENVVASLGTAFTEEHAKILSRCARKIIFCYDSDEAGQRATVRALPMMQRAGAEVFVLIVPDGKDPDEFIQKHGKTAFEELLKNVTPVVDYFFQYKIDHTDSSTLGGKMQILSEMLPLCLEIKNSVIQKEYLKKFSARLFLDESLVMGEWRKVSSRSLRSKNTQNEDSLSPKNSLVRQSGATIIKTLWQEPELLNYVYLLTATEDFIEIHAEIIRYIEKCYLAEKMPDSFSANEELSPQANFEISRILMNNEPPEVQSIAFQDSVNIMKRISLERRYKKILNKSCELLKADDEKSYNEKPYKQKLQSLLNIQKELSEF